MKRKITALFMAVLMLMSLVACSGKDDKNDPSSTDPATSDIPVLSASTKGSSEDPEATSVTTTTEPPMTTTTTEVTTTTAATTTTTATTASQGGPSDGFESVLDTVYVTASALNMRTSPDLGDNIYGQAALGEALKRTGFNNEWCRVDYNGKTLYVSLKYVSEEDPNAIMPFETRYETVYITAPGALNLREKPSMAGEVGKISATLPFGTELIRVGYDADWSKVLYNGMMLYCGSKYLSTTKP